MHYKMIFGRTQLFFFKKGKHLLLKEVRLLNQDIPGDISGSTRLLYDEETCSLQRYVNGSAPLAGLSHDMVCFLAEISRCCGRLTQQRTWKDDMWLCVGAFAGPEKAETSLALGRQKENSPECNIISMLQHWNSEERLGEQ